VVISKKGQQLKFLLTAVLLLVLMSVIIYMIYSYAVKGAGGEISGFILEQKIEFCQLKSKQTQFQPGGPQDKDGDNILDSCDICLYKDPTGRWVGDNTLNSDDDLMPDFCDENPSKTERNPRCDKNKNLVWDKESSRCTIKAG